MSGAAGPPPRRSGPPAGGRAAGADGGAKKGSVASSCSQRYGSVAGSAYSYRAASRWKRLPGEGRAAERAALAGARRLPQVFDDQGKDVTPRPLFQPDPSSVAPKQGKILVASDYSAVTGSGFLSSFSMQQTSGMTTSLAGPFSRSYGSSSVSKSYASTDSLADDIAEPSPRRDTSADITDVQVRREEVKEQLTSQELDRRVDIYLTETETFWIFDMPSAVMSVEAEDAGRVLERNKIYVDVCKNRVGNERFVERMMQTLNGAPKTKEVQCDKIITEDKGITVTSWDLYDSFNELEEEATSEAEGRRVTVVSSNISLVSGQRDEPTSSICDRDSTTSSVLETALLAKIHEEQEDHSEAILKSEKFHQDLFFMERILMENVFQPKLAVYRQLPVLIEPVATSNTGDRATAREEADPEKEEHEQEEQEEEEQKDVFIAPSVLSNLSKGPEELVPPSLELLWSYTCDLTNGRSVSSMAWNKLNPDLLAVGYGEFDFKEQKNGLVCCWSLKNPMWPERVFHCEHGVTALDFSAVSPNLLAVGMYSGIVAIYNVQSRNNAALLDSSESSDKHIGPVWQLKWVEQDRGTTGDDKGEILISISADGRITKWFIRKGLGCSDLMKIKRTVSEKKKTTGEKERKSEALISRQAPGMCFDFHPKIIPYDGIPACGSVMRAMYVMARTAPLPKEKLFVPQRQFQHLLLRGLHQHMKAVSDNDTNFYLAGTEEGLIHKCSCSYNEQFVETYRGHKGPVYKIAWNPFSTDMFLSCSADWSIILWHQESQKPILTFASTAAVVHDIVWSPKSVFIFVAVNESRVEIWDLSISTLDPLVIRFAAPKVKFTTVLFAKTTDCLLLGDSKGQVSVFELQNLGASHSNKVDALQDIIGSALAT